MTTEELLAKLDEMLERVATDLATHRWSDPKRGRDYLAGMRRAVFYAHHLVNTPAPCLHTDDVLAEIRKQPHNSCGAAERATRRCRQCGFGPSHKLHTGVGTWQHSFEPQT